MCKFTNMVKEFQDSVVDVKLKKKKSFERIFFEFYEL